MFEDKLLKEKFVSRSAFSATLLTQKFSLKSFSMNDFCKGELTEKLFFWCCFFREIVLLNWTSERVASFIGSNQKEQSNQ